MGAGGRKRAVPVNIIDDVDGNSSQKSSEYEQLREKRIKENQERMQKLGIFDISLKLKSFNQKTTSTPKTVGKTPRRLSPTQLPLRRSSRLQNATPLSYSEAHLSKIDKSLEGEHHLRREEGSRLEIYTEEHEKLLGTTDLSWTPFADGYGRDGKRIYDPVKGKTCHQCRQKTLGHRTHCSQCNMVQGQFCGDCLFMRYGEHVLEAKKNPNWICPVCRGICNCSLCRLTKGWAPTGPLYKKIARLGYKSVAHYLIQTHRDNVSTEKKAASAKRSLPFSDMEAITTDEICISDSQRQVTTTRTEVKTVEHDPVENKVAPESCTVPLLKPAFAVGSTVEPLLLTHESENRVTKLVLPCDLSADNEPRNENTVLVGSALTSNAPVLTGLNDGYKGESQLGNELDVRKNQSKDEKEDGICVSDDKSFENNVAPENSMEPLMRAFAVESSVEPLLPMKHDSEHSGTNLVLSYDNGGGFSADNEPGNENDILVGSASTSSALVLTELNDGYKGKPQLGYESAAAKRSKEEKEDGTCVSDDKNCCDVVAPEASSKSKKRPCRAAAQLIH